MGKPPDTGELQAQRSFAQALSLLADDRLLAALPLVEEALQQSPDNALYLSYYAMLIALERGQVRRGLELSQAALERGGELADIHFNTARIYLKAERKQEAIYCLRAGLERQKDHPGIIATLRQLGIRRRPVLPFLPRKNLLNKYLGLLAHRLGRRHQRG